MKRPWFKFYPSDYLVGTADLSAEEVGIYIRMLCYQWEKGALPAEVARLVILTGGKKMAVAAVMKKFVARDEDGLLINERLEAVRLEMEAYSRERSESGKRGGQAKQSASRQPSKSQAELQAELEQNASKPEANGEAEHKQKSSKSEVRSQIEEERESAGGSAQAGTAESMTLDRAWVNALFGAKKTAPLGYSALHSLADISPLPDDEKDLVAWYYRLPADDAVIELRSRRLSAAALLENWRGEVDKARGYARKVGRNGVDTRNRRASWPDGAREWVIAEFAENESFVCPEKFADLPAAVQAAWEARP